MKLWMTMMLAGALFAAGCSNVKPTPAPDAPTDPAAPGAKPKEVRPPGGYRGS